MLAKKGLLGILASVALVAAFSIRLTAKPKLGTQTKHHQYEVIVLPPDGGSNSFLAGYLFYAPLTDRGTVGVAADTSVPGAPPFNSYTRTKGEQVDFQPLAQLPNLTGTNTYINWINQWGLAAGYGTRTDSITGVSLDHAAIWTPDGQIFELSTPTGDQSRGVWVNDFGQVSGWIENSTMDPCAFGVGLQFQSQAVIWRFGGMQLLGTLGGINSYGEFTNNLGQVSGHSETSTTSNGVTGCPPFDPFIWENGKMTDINPGNFGGAQGGTNFLNNQGDAVGFGTTPMEAGANAFLWSRGKLTNLSDIGSFGNNADSGFDVNELGHVVGVSGTSTGGVLGVLWRGQEFINLSTLSGDDCSEPFFINSHDQVIGISFSCETGVQRAFLWENGGMVDLNTLIPPDLGLELQSAAWINDDGVIAAQAVLTQGANAGAQRAVLLFPDGESESNEAVASPRGADKAAISSFANQATGKTLRTAPVFMTKDGRVDPRFLRPFSVEMMRRKVQN